MSTYYPSDCQLPGAGVACAEGCGGGAEEGGGEEGGDTSQDTAEERSGTGATTRGQ